MKKHISAAFLIWIPFAALIAFASLLGYGLTQQSMRMAANDPQVQAVDDISAGLAAGATPDEIVSPGQTVDISASPDTFIIIYSASGTVLESSAMLNGATPALPVGIFSYTAAHGEDRFTWEPQPGIRAAAVVKTFTGQTSGFILAGRTISEIEDRETKIMHDAAIACILGWIVMFFIIWITLGVYHKKHLTV